MVAPFGRVARTGEHLLFEQTVNVEEHLFLLFSILIAMVGLGGLEPPTSPLISLA